MKQNTEIIFLQSCKDIFQKYFKLSTVYYIHV